jgi:hypothetical protein
MDRNPRFKDQVQEEPPPNYKDQIQDDPSYVPIADAVPISDSRIQAEELLEERILLLEHQMNNARGPDQGETTTGEPDHGEETERAPDSFLPPHPEGDDGDTSSPLSHKTTVGCAVVVLLCLLGIGATAGFICGGTGYCNRVEAPMTPNPGPQPSHPQNGPWPFSDTLMPSL